MDDSTYHRERHVIQELETILNEITEYLRGGNPDLNETMKLVSLYKKASRLQSYLQVK